MEGNLVGVVQSDQATIAALKHKMVATEWVSVAWKGWICEAARVTWHVSYMLL